RSAGFLGSFSFAILSSLTARLPPDETGEPSNARAPEPLDTQDDALRQLDPQHAATNASIAASSLSCATRMDFALIAASGSDAGTERQKCLSRAACVAAAAAHTQSTKMAVLRREKCI